MLRSLRFSAALLLGTLLYGCGSDKPDRVFVVTPAPGIIEENPEEAAEDQAWVGELPPASNIAYSEAALAKGLVPDQEERVYGESLRHEAPAPAAVPPTPAAAANRPLSAKQILERARARAEAARTAQEGGAAPATSEPVLETAAVTLEEPQEEQQQPVYEVPPAEDPSAPKASPAEMQTASLTPSGAGTSPQAEPEAAVADAEEPGEVGKAVEALTLANAPDAASLAAGPGYLIQLAALPSVEYAEQEWLRLQHTFPGILGQRELEIGTVDLGARGLYFRIQTGLFASADEARAACATLRLHHQDCFVVGR